MVTIDVEWTSMHGSLYFASDAFIIGISHEDSRFSITAFSATTLVLPKPVAGMFHTGAEAGGAQLDAPWSPFASDWFHFSRSISLYVFLRATIQLNPVRRSIRFLQ